MARKSIRWLRSFANNLLFKHIDLQKQWELSYCFSICTIMAGRSVEMVETVLEYLRDYGGLSFREKPLNDVDALALCQLSYLKFEGLVPETEGEKMVLLKELACEERVEYLFTDKRFERENRALFRSMSESRRFENLGLNFYVTVVDKTLETQFSAITFFPEGEYPFLAYRGTDESIVGWKEDFNMAYRERVPGQFLGRDYLEWIAGKIEGGLYLGGHSKGGYLAVYSAMTCTELLQDRIVRVYSMDGPGLRQDLLIKDLDGRLGGKIRKFLPHCSLVGLLFEQSHRYFVVESRALGILQHDPFTWIVKGDHFELVPDVYQSRKKADSTLNRWMDALEESQLHLMIETVFTVLEASRASDLIQFGNFKKQSLAGMVRALGQLDDKTRRGLADIWNILLEIAGEDALQEVSSWQRKIGTFVKRRR